MEVDLNNEEEKESNKLNEKEQTSGPGELAVE